jgi:hypothetical protein
MIRTKTGRRCDGWEDRCPHLRRKFPIGCSVELSPNAKETWPRYANKTGIVISYEELSCPVVQWSKGKRGIGYNPCHIRRKATEEIPQ